MLAIFDGIRDITMLSVAVRMFLAVICGGIIGLEREYKRRPAGFRTHILICLGAAMTTVTSQYMYLYMNYFTDMARLGAQVVAGVGFIGAGTIITRRERVKGLTTAAGLWAAAIVGLSAGAGFYEGAIVATILIEMAELVFAKLEYNVLEHSPIVNLYVEYAGKESLAAAMDYFKENNIRIQDLEITRSKVTSKHNACAILTLRMNRQITATQLISHLKASEGIILVDEL